MWFLVGIRGDEQSLKYKVDRIKFFFCITPTLTTHVEQKLTQSEARWITNHQYFKYNKQYSSQKIIYENSSNPTISSKGRLLV